ncbi:MAG: hypothetical protein UZ21_OP11001000158 [Microgenomates bacterium OLB22]|nr:MAG: hypothetical protein UZ21_OP11001000158 [Microgenomates bacterium OLB22]
MMAETKQLSKTQKMLNVWAVVLILWSLYRTANIAMPLWFDEFIAKPAVFILPVLWFIHRYEGATIWDGLWLSRKNIRSSLYYALAIGAFFRCHGGHRKHHEVWPLLYGCHAIFTLIVHLGDDHCHHCCYSNLRGDSISRLCHKTPL